MASIIIDSSTTAPDDIKGPTGPGTGSPHAQPSSWPPPAIDRLSAVPSLGMVRDPNLNPNFIDSNIEEIRGNKRSSSIGATFRRLFSKSPTPQERSSSEAKSILGQEAPESADGAIKRGRTPPKKTDSPNVSSGSQESSTIPPNNSIVVLLEHSEQIRGIIWGGAHATLLILSNLIAPWPYSRRTVELALCQQR